LHTAIEVVNEAAQWMIALEGHHQGVDTELPGLFL